MKQSVCVWKPTIATLNKKKKKKEKEKLLQCESGLVVSLGTERRLSISEPSAARESATDQLRGESERPASVNYLQELFSRRSEEMQLKKKGKKLRGWLIKLLASLYLKCAKLFFSLFSSNVLSLKENINREPLKVFYSNWSYYGSFGVKGTLGLLRLYEFLVRTYFLKTSKHLDNKKNICGGQELSVSSCFPFRRREK